MEITNVDRELDRLRAPERRDHREEEQSDGRDASRDD